MRRPLITVGITCYNAADTIGRAISSALAQDWPSLDVLIVDDCSKDDSVDVAERCIAGDERARLLRHSVNQGAAAARNTLLAAAKGEFIAFFDDDDESFPARLRVQYERLTQYEAETGATLVACFASGARRYPNGYQKEIDAIGSRPQVPKGEAVAQYLLFNERAPGVFYGGGTPTCSLMARVATFRTIGGFDTSLRRVEDVDFAVRLALSGGHFIGTTQKLYLQYATTGSEKTAEANLASELRMLDKHREFLRRKGRYSYARDWFRIRALHFQRRRVRFALHLAAFLLRHPISGIRHLLRSGPARLRHEQSMARDRNPEV